MDPISAQVIDALTKRAVSAETSQRAAERTAKSAVVSLAIVIGVGITAVGIGLWQLPIERYLYSDNAKEICEAQLEAEPLVTSNTVMDFAKECMLDMDTFSHDSLERDLTKVANRCFTPSFRKTYFEAPWLGERIDTVKEQFLRVSAETSGPVLVESEALTALGYKWIVQVKVKRTFRQGENIKGRQERVYRVHVYRVTKNAFNPVGLGVNAIDERTQ